MSEDIRAVIQQRKVRDIVVLTPSGDVDPHVAPALERVAQSRIKDGDVRLAIDLSAANVLTSLGLQVLIRIQRSTRAAEGKLVLFGLTAMAREILEKTRLDTVLTVCKDLDEAEQRLVLGE